MGNLQKILENTVLNKIVLPSWGLGKSILWRKKEISEVFYVDIVFYSL